MRQDAQQRLWSEMVPPCLVVQTKRCVLEHAHA